jgi:apolipoprotein N-acyltransferase
VLFKYLSDGTWRDYVYFTSAWVACEWLAAWWFSIQNIGPGMVVAPDFSLGFLGNLLANDNSLLQFAWLGGVYVLSVVAAVIGMLLYRMRRAERREKKFAIVTIAGLALCWLGGHALLQYIPSHSQFAIPIRVAAVSLQRPATFAYTKEQVLAQYSEVIHLLPDTAGASIVVLPESSGFLRTPRLPTGLSVRDEFIRIYGASGTVPTIVDSASISDHGTPRYRLEFYDATTDSSQFRYKRSLLPGGEYLPYLYRPFFTAFGQGSVLKTILVRRGFTAGSSPSPIVTNGISIGALFCNEAMSPNLYSSLAKKGATIFINIASHSWFHGSHLVATQMENVAKIRAVESRRWYIQATDVAPSVILDPYGRVVARSAWGREEVIGANVYEREGMTPYTRVGTWIPIALILFLCTVTLRKRRLLMIS